MRKKRHLSPYARVDWKKATVLFQRPLVPLAKAPQFPAVKTILHGLAAAGSGGLTFLFEAGRHGVVDYSLGNFSYEDWRARKILRQLKSQKYVSVVEHPDGKVTISITKGGLLKALTYELDSMKLIKQKKWDHKWRVVIFDILEKHKRIRDIFRMRLKQLGLCQLQESIYVSPYPCFDEVEFLRELYGVAFTVRYLLVERIEDDGFLKKYFGFS